MLLGAADLSIGYQLKEARYDGVNHKWLQPDTQKRARHYPAQSWVALDLRHIKVALPKLQALVRLSAVPGMWQRDKTLSRLYEAAEELLTKPIPVTKPAQNWNPSYRMRNSPYSNAQPVSGCAPLNRQGQAIGLFSRLSPALAGCVSKL